MAIGRSGLPGQRNEPSASTSRSSPPAGADAFMFSPDTIHQAAQMFRVSRNGECIDNAGRIEVVWEIDLARSPTP